MSTLKTEWDLSRLLEKDIDAQITREGEAAKKIIETFVKKWKNDLSYTKDPKKLREALDDDEKISENFPLNKVAYGLHMLREKNQNDPNVLALANKLETMAVKLHNEMTFFSVNISKIKEKEQKKFLESSDLKEYKHMLEKTFEHAKHVLSEPEEKIMNMKEKTSYSNWVEMLEELLSKEEEKVFIGTKEELKNFGEIMNLLDNKNKKIRDSAAKAFNKILAKHKDVALKEINSVLENKKVNMEIRKYEFPESARLLADDVDLKFVESLRKEVSKKFELSKRYYELKAKLVGQKKLEYHERNIEYGEIEEKFPFEKSTEIVKEIMAEFDEETGKLATKFFEEGRVDAFPKKGKNPGAFCTVGMKKLPVFVLLNHDGSFRNLQVMAHELGHGMNHELMKKQKECYYSISLATAEVASTFFENTVINRIKEKADQKTRLALLMGDLNNLISSVFRQIACYNLEKDLHETFAKEGYISEEKIREIFLRNMKSYMGEAVEQSPGCENWWIYWSHIREYFYVYSYSSGLLISKFLQRQYSKDKSFAKKIKEFLSAGTSKSPRAIFKDLGIEINEKFWEEGLKQIEDQLNETEALAKELKLI